MARKGDYRAAELIYRTQAEFLLSTERKQDLASIYLDFADAYFKPEDELTKPDYAQCLKFYQKVLEVGPAPVRRAEVELLVGQCLENIQNWGEATKRYAAFVKKYQGQEPVDDALNTLKIDAAYRLGWCQFKQGQLSASDMARLVG